MLSTKAALKMIDYLKIYSVKTHFNPNNRVPVKPNRRQRIRYNYLLKMLKVERLN
jgi:hypothetical protein